MLDSKLNAEDVDKFLRKTGNKGARIISILGSNQPFYEAIHTDLGQEILKDAIMIMESLLEKIVNEESTDAERAEYRALKKITTLWAERINNYLARINEIKK